MKAVDPTYPLYPAASLLAAALLLLVLLTSFIRQRWNLGVAFLCFWLFFENLTGAINAIVWSDNSDVKLYVYCDIVSHLEIICYTVRPMATLIITRRLYLIANLQSVELPSRRTRCLNALFEWSLGLVIPALVAGSLYYIVQAARFQVVEGSGCADALYESVLMILIILSWGIAAPLLSIVFYYPQIVRLLYFRNRDVNRYLKSNDSVSRQRYLRIFALASIDILLTLPINIATLVLSLSLALDEGPIPFYPGWTFSHSSWAPISTSYVELQASMADVALFYFTDWIAPVLGFVIFALFGFTDEARASYWSVLRTGASWVGWKVPGAARGHDSGRMTMDTIRFGEPQSVSRDGETGTCSSAVAPKLEGDDAA